MGLKQRIIRTSVTQDLFETLEKIAEEEDMSFDGLIQKTLKDRAAVREKNKA